MIFEIYSLHTPYRITVAKLSPFFCKHARTTKFKSHYRLQNVQIRYRGWCNPSHRVQWPHMFELKWCTTKRRTRFRNHCTLTNRFAGSSKSPYIYIYANTDRGVDKFCDLQALWYKIIAKDYIENCIWDVWQFSTSSENVSIGNYDVNGVKARFKLLERCNKLHMASSMAAVRREIRERQKNIKQHVRVYLGTTIQHICTHMKYNEHYAGTRHIYTQVVVCSTYYIDWIAFCSCVFQHASIRRYVNKSNQ